MEWIPQLMATGVDLVDQQHQEIIRRVNALTDMIDREDDFVVPEIENLIDFLADYVIVHFRSEESLQQEVAYDGYTAHKEEHEGFIQRFVEIRQRYQRGGATPGNVQKLLDMSESWLSEHIAGSDARFAACYRAVKQ